MSRVTTADSSAREKAVTVFLMILVAVCLEVVGQLLYKAGLNHTATVPGSLLEIPNLLTFAGRALSNWRVLTGLGIYGGEVLLWWVVLSKVDVSYAFPLTSLSYVLLLAVAGFFLHEHVNVERWLGAITIMVGVFLITRSAPH